MYDDRVQDFRCLPYDDLNDVVVSPKDQGITCRLGFIAERTINRRTARFKSTRLS